MKSKAKQTPPARKRSLLSRPKEADGIKVVLGKERLDDQTQDQDKEIETAKVESGEVLRTLREVPPTHYLLHIESFKALIACLNKMGLRCYRSKDFQVSNYSWKLLLYPGIEKEGNGKIYLSLKMMNPPLHRDIQAVVIFFLYDQREKKYLSIQEIKTSQFGEDENWQSKRFPIASLKEFEDASSRYLVNDRCTFGVEVFVLENENKHESVFRTLKKTNENVYIWNVKKPYDLMGRGMLSPAFSIENLTWKLHVYSKGNEEKGKYWSISLCLPKDQNEFSLGWKAYVEFKLSLSYNHHKLSKRGKAWFSGNDRAWGFPKFINWDDLREYDGVDIEAQIISISMSIEKNVLKHPFPSDDISTLSD
ncbi:hypothetical protein GQ457_17G000470 [Hibiscus cannabinus]